MKTAQDPRHRERIKIVQELFAWEFSTKEPSSNPKTQNIIKNLERIDQTIKEAAPAWPIAKINRVDLSILRQAVYELVVEGKTPPKVIVDEAIEIAKEYGSESSPSFINGALGKVITSCQQTP